MQSFVVFPICDLRRLIDKDLAMDKPSWTMPQAHRDFVRALGGVKDARDCGVSLRGLDGWIVEPFVCDAKRGATFDDMPTMTLERRRVQWRVDNRLLYFDSRCGARVEYQLGADLTGGHGGDPVAYDDIHGFLCRLKLKVRRHEGAGRDAFDSVDFGRSGLLHARALAARTIPKGLFGDLDNVRRCIRYMRPAFVHVLAVDEDLTLGRSFVKVRNGTSRYIDVFHDRVRIFGSLDVPVWVIRPAAKANARDLRDLALYLRRLHCEYECLKLLLREIEVGRVPLDDGYLPEAMETYLRDLLKRVRQAESKLLREGALGPAKTEGQPSMVDLASVSIHDLNPTLYAQIDTAVRRARFRWRSNENLVKRFLADQIARGQSAEINLNIRNLNVDNRQSVTNSTGVTLTQAGRDAQVHIDRSFNGFQEASSDAGLVQALADLKDLLDRAIQEGDAVRPETLARDYAELAEEAGSDAPRPEKVEMNGKMILGAIKEGSGLIAAISKAVESVAKLIA